MFKILVDGMPSCQFSDTFRGCVTVGSAADVLVHLDRGAPLSLEIRPLTGGEKDKIAVTVHEPEGVTHHTREWFRERKPVDVWYAPAEEFRLDRGNADDSITVRGHRIQVINGCWTCGKEADEMWECTCWHRRT